MKIFFYTLLIILSISELNAKQLINNTYIKEYKNGDMDFTIFKGILNLHMHEILNKPKHYKKENIKKIYNKKTHKLEEICFYSKEQELDGSQTIFWTSKLTMKKDVYILYEYHYDDLRRKLFYKDSKYIKDEAYVNGKLWGTTTYVWENEKIKLATKKYKGQVVKIVPFKNAKVHGIVKEFDQNQNLKKLSHFKDGILDGKEIEYRGRELASERFYKNGKRDGKETWYNSDGTIFSIQNFKLGKAEGKPRFK